MIPKSMSSTPIGDGNRFSEMIMRTQKCQESAVNQARRIGIFP